jgi:hypothetical protein
MTKKQFFLKLALIITVSSFSNSCKQEDIQLIARGDVLIKSVQKGDSIFYGVYYYAYSYDKMAKVTVYREGEETKMALDSMEGRYTFTSVPDSSEFKTTKPLKKKFIFNVEFDNGEQFETYDILDSNSLKPVVIKDVTFDQEDEKLKIVWEVNALADQYVVALEREDKEIVYISDFLSGNLTYLWINSDSYNWSANKHPNGGEKYKVLLWAYQYEAIPSAWDLQSVSVAESGYIEWKVN